MARELDLQTRGDGAVYLAAKPQAGGTFIIAVKADYEPLSTGPTHEAETILTRGDLFQLIATATELLAADEA